MRRPVISLHGRLVALLASLVLVALAAAAPVGAANQPSLVKNINPHGSSNPTELTAVGSTLFFAANDGVHGNELWKSDGTKAGTVMVKNIRPYGKSSDPENLVNVNGRLFFTAKDGVHGRELWRSDGTKAGTVMVRDLHPGYGGNSTYLHEGGAFAVGNQLFFLVDWCCQGTGGLYVSDGTAAGTRLPESFYGDFEFPETASAGTAGGKFYFVAGLWFDSGFEWQLWVSDGTDSGTHRVDGSPAAESMSIFPTNGTKLYFYTDRVWRTDGTAAGTKPLTAAGQPPAAPTESVLLNSRLYFNGSGLWKTDGTVSGTKKISNGAPAWLTVAGSTVFFTRGSHLWKSDGTAAGTKDMGQFGAQTPRQLIGVGTQLCFAEMDWDAGTWSLWESNGTAAGTYRVRSFAGTPDELQQAAVGSKLFFAANDITHGVELWRYTP